MSEPEYYWVAMGEASGLPVFTTGKKYQMVLWLSRRRGLSQVRVFRMKSDSRLEVCVPCLMDNPDKPAKERGHK